MSRYGSLFVGLGLVAFGSGLLSLILAMAGASQGIFQFSIASFWIFANLVAGLGLLGAGIAANLAQLRERMRSGEARRVRRYGTSAIASTALALAIIGLLAFLSTRYNAKFDWSEAGEHSLSEQTLQVLEDLDQEVELLALFHALEVEPVRRLLDRYAYVSDLVRVRLADPNEHPDLARAIERDQLARGVVHITIGEESTDVTEVTEERVTNAIVRLTRTQDKKVYFVSGHNERKIVGPGAGDASGFELAAEFLRNENYAVEELLLASVDGIPEDGDAIVLAGPTRPFREEEHQALEEFLARGGGMLVMLDPRANTDLSDALARWGVEVGDDIVYSARYSLFLRPNWPFARSYGDHPITRDLREVTLFSIARSVRAAEDADGRFTEIVVSGEDSWAETDLDGSEVGPDPEDPSGPQPLALAGTVELTAGLSTEEGEEDVAAEARPGRLVVYGDADFASNQLINAHRNRDLFLNTVNWLLGEVEHISIRPVRARASSFELSQDEFDQIRLLSLLVMPWGIAILGVFAWWSRRKAPGR